MTLSAPSHLATARAQRLSTRRADPPPPAKVSPPSAPSLPFTGLSICDPMCNTSLEASASNRGRLYSALNSTIIQEQ